MVRLGALRFACLAFLGITLGLVTHSDSQTAPKDQRISLLRPDGSPGASIRIPAGYWVADAAFERKESIASLLLANADGSVVEAWSNSKRLHQWRLKPDDGPITGLFGFNGDTSLLAVRGNRPILLSFERPAKRTFEQFIPSIIEFSKGLDQPEAAIRQKTVVESAVPIYVYTGGDNSGAMELFEYYLYNTPRLADNKLAFSRDKKWVVSESINRVSWASKGESGWKSGSVATRLLFQTPHLRDTEVLSLSLFPRFITVSVRIKGVPFDNYRTMRFKVDGGRAITVWEKAGLACRDLVRFNQRPK